MDGGSEALETGTDWRADGGGGGAQARGFDCDSEGFGPTSGGVQGVAGCCSLQRAGAIRGPVRAVVQFVPWAGTWDLLRWCLLLGVCVGVRCGRTCSSVVSDFCNPFCPSAFLGLGDALCRVPGGRGGQCFGNVKSTAR